MKYQVSITASVETERKVNVHNISSRKTAKELMLTAYAKSLVGMMEVKRDEIKNKQRKKRKCK